MKLFAIKVIKNQFGLHKRPELKDGSVLTYFEAGDMIVASEAQMELQKEGSFEVICEVKKPEEKKGKKRGPKPKQEG